jgi:4-hydroxy-tetrahydrodipicolinate reductase
MIKVFVNGFNGRMGSEVVRAVAGAADMQLVGGYDPHAATDNILLDGVALAPAAGELRAGLEAAKPDCMVDFTLPQAAVGNIKVGLELGIDCVVGTTGVTVEVFRELASAAPAGTTLFVAPNFTTGAVLMMQFAKAAARFFPDAEVIEFHHNHKADAPSGTALSTARMIAAERELAGISKTAPGKETEVAGAEGARGADVNGVVVHSVRSDGYVAHQEVIFGSAGQTLTIRHDSIDRSSYMPGVLLAIRSVGQRSGFIYGLETLMDL